MMEDKLTQNQRIRLEALAQTVASRTTTSVPSQVIETASKFEDYIIHGKSEFPKREGEFIKLGPDVFTDRASQIISYKQQFYYKACGQWVKRDDGPVTSCILPEIHEHATHIDEHNNMRGI